MKKKILSVILAAALTCSMVVGCGSSKETAKDDKWTQIINGMTIYTDTALKAYLEQAGFCKIQNHKNKKGWLCVTARK